MKPAKQVDDSYKNTPSQQWLILDTKNYLDSLDV